MPATAIMITAMTTDLDKTLTALTQHAPTLRAAGVQSFTVSPDGTVTATLAPHDPAPATNSAARDEDFRDLLDDPATYGRSNGRAPGFDPPQQHDD